MTQNDAKEDSPPDFSPEGLYKFWAETLKLPTIGPMFAFSKEFSNYANDIINLGKVMSELKSHNDNYWSLITATYAKAAKATFEKSPKQLVSKEDYEIYRRAMIEAFEDAFTGLFSSPEFSVIYGKVFSAQLDFSKALQSLSEKNLKILNLPTRSEIDEILKDLHDLRKSVRELRKQIEVSSDDKAGSDGT
jgi:poly[(R)-3-hydroxyalkanoate] polymerase subunit PhaE